MNRRSIETLVLVGAVLLLAGMNLLKTDDVAVAIGATVVAVGLIAAFLVWRQVDSS